MAKVKLPGDTSSDEKIVSSSAIRLTSSPDPTSLVITTHTPDPLTITNNPLTSSLYLHTSSDFLSPVRAFKATEELASVEKTLAQMREHESEKAKLVVKVNEMAKALNQQKLEGQQKDQAIKDYEQQLRALKGKESLSHLLQRVGPAAQEKLLQSSDFKARFAPDSPSNAYVLSIDIRRSTELMLKARDPKLFAEFIITLTEKLSTPSTKSCCMFLSRQIAWQA